MIEILSFRPHHKGNLIGFVNIKIPKWGNFIIKDISLFEKNEGRWLNFPSRSYEENGEKKYSYYNCFEDQTMKSNFDHEVFKALDLYLQKKAQNNEDLIF